MENNMLNTYRTQKLLWPLTGESLEKQYLHIILDIDEPFASYKIQELPQKQELFADHQESLISMNIENISQEAKMDNHLDKDVHLTDTEILDKSVNEDLSELSSSFNTEELKEELIDDEVQDIVEEWEKEEEYLDEVNNFEDVLQEESIPEIKQEEKQLEEKQLEELVLESDTSLSFNNLSEELNSFHLELERDLNNQYIDIDPELKAHQSFKLDPEDDIISNHFQADQIITPENQGKNDESIDSEESINFISSLQEEKILEIENNELVEEISDNVNFLEEKISNNLDIQDELIVEDDNILLPEEDSIDDINLIEDSSEPHIEEMISYDIQEHHSDDITDDLLEDHIQEDLEHLAHLQKQEVDAELMLVQKKQELEDLLTHVDKMIERLPKEKALEYEKKKYQSLYGHVYDQLGL